MKKLISKGFILFMLVLTYSIQAQNSEVQGTVTDVSGVPLSGASITVKGTSKGVIADFDGNYSINVLDSDVLSISYLGYLTQEVPVNGRNSINVSLKEDASQLDEVVVVGYGTQKKINLTGAITTVNAEEIENRPITSATQLLSGLASGVSVSQTSGRPGGDDAAIRIRGVGTLGNNNPLVLIDGLAGSLSNVNPSDIESVTVLKDAASTSIYGSSPGQLMVLYL
ncbi:hypothetical protein DHD32_17870 [Arenibacter sp. TNZ]|jgi:TonB-dependent SusC/RagA subfamily outer membrane receptor|uniref:TonB-dependent receptor plug domain-containing protein n=1 Tax=Arenibacter TaxID=178469 RepID=UPI000CD43E0F|nr:MULTISPECIES: TonB-dependent receptor plug domain-containing protein [Arenibacter]MCM4173347.1 hypothetical protein [Arenibacter sp. TNZ]